MTCRNGRLQNAVCRGSIEIHVDAVRCHRGQAVLRARNQPRILRPDNLLNLIVVEENEQVVGCVVQIPLRLMIRSLRVNGLDHLNQAGVVQRDNRGTGV